MPKKKQSPAKKVKKKIKKNIKKVNKEQYSLIKSISIRLFGNLAEKQSYRFGELKSSILKADVKILFRTYLSIMFFLTAFIFVLTFILTLVISLFIGLGVIATILGSLILSVSFSVIIFLLYYLYPITLSQRRKSDIDSNMPFAINHMAAIAGSGVPPRVMFKVISRFKEYGEIAVESRKIVRNIEILGMDEMTSMKDVASKTPSVVFKDFLQGILSTIMTGGNMKSYLDEEAEKALFDYRINRNKYVQQLTIYADFYTALLIAAPLVFIVMLPILGVLQGTMFGFTLQELINFGLVSLVVLNLLFILFLQITQKKM